MGAHPSRVRQYASMSMTLLLGQLIYYAVYFWGIRIILSTLPKEENGIVTLVQQWSMTVFSILLMTGYNTFLVHQLRTEHTQRQLYSTVVWLRAGLGILGALGLSVALTFLAGIHPAVTLIGATAVLLLASSNTLRTTLELHLQAQMRFATIVLLSILDSILIVLLLWWNQSCLNALTIFAIQALGTLPSFITLLVIAWRQNALKLSFDRSALDILFRHATPLSLVTVFIYTHTIVDITLLAFLSGKASVGILGATNYATVPLSVLQGVLWTPLIPLLSQAIGENLHAARPLLVRAVRLVPFLIGFVGSILAAAAPLVITLLTRGTYRDHTVEFLLQLWVFGFAAILFAVQHYGILLSQYRIALAATSGLVIGSFLFDWWLIGAWATVGLLLAKLLSHILACIIAAVMFVRSEFPEIGREIGRLLLWMSAGGAVVGGAYGLLPTAMLGRGFAISVGILGMAVAIRVVDWDDRALVLRILRRQASSP